jgi:phospholipid-binding lipoprotein MlaA
MLDADGHGQLGPKPRAGVGLALLLVAGLCFGATGCASIPEDPQAQRERAQENDPLEGFNRMIFAINRAGDTFVFRPLAVAYRDLVPDTIKENVRSFARNLGAPLVFVNDLLQGEWSRAQTTLARFIVNTTIGGLGIADAASSVGLVHHDEDFGQTLASWGVGDGFYLVLPIFGPSNLRDATGRAVDWLMNPTRHLAKSVEYDEEYLGVTVGEAVDTRYRLMKVLDEQEAASLDYYATVRSLYRQRRQDEINNRQSNQRAKTP